MQKQTEPKRETHYLSDIVRGAVGSGVFFLLLLLSALLSDHHAVLMSEKLPTAKLCLFLGSVIAGALSGRGGERAPFLHAIFGETILFLTVFILTLLERRTSGFLSLAVNAAVLIFGAFAGTLLFGSARRKQRGKR